MVEPRRARVSRTALLALAAACAFVAFAPRSAEGASQSAEAKAAAATELGEAFKMCDAAFLTVDLQKRADLADDYKARRTHALHVDPKLASTAHVGLYVPKEMLKKCDTELPRVIEGSRRRQAQQDVDQALDLCRAALQSGNTDAAEAKYKTFKTLSTQALTLDPAIGTHRLEPDQKTVREELGTCDTKVAAFIKQRREIEAAAVKRYWADHNPQQNGKKSN